MIPSGNFFVGGGATATTISTLAAAILVLAVLLILAVPRRYIVMPLLLAVFLIPQGNVIVLAGLHFPPARLLAPTACVRLFFSKPRVGESRLAAGWTRVDSAFLGCGLATAVAVILQWMSISALNNQLGVLMGSFGAYFALRQLIRDDKDITTAIRTLIVVAMINALSMANEQWTLHNLFGTILEGVQPWTLVREGRARAQGAFQQPILAGVFGATLVPLCCWLWKTEKSRPFAALGIVSGTAMMLLSSSSTPVMAYMGTAIAICLWPIRRSMRLVRWGLSATLTALHLVMKAPVWFLIARVDLVGGSASFDRANLIDTCVRHFSNWWLIGTHDTSNWGWSMWDLSDEFVGVAETGGLLALVLFIAVISRSFGALGASRRAASSKRDEWCFWFLGAAIFSHVMAYFGVSYFDQTEIAWLVLLAIIPAATQAGATPPALATTIAEKDVDFSQSPWLQPAR